MKIALDACGHQANVLLPRQTQAPDGAAGPPTRPGVCGIGAGTFACVNEAPIAFLQGGASLTCGISIPRANTARITGSASAISAPQLQHGVFTSIYRSEVERRLVILSDLLGFSLLHVRRLNGDLQPAFESRHHAFLRGMTRRYFDVAGALPYARRQDNAPYLELLQMHFPEALSWPAIWGAKLVKTGARQLSFYLNRLANPGSHLVPQHPTVFARLGLTSVAESFTQPPAFPDGERLIDDDDPYLGRSGIRQKLAADTLSNAAQKLLFHCTRGAGCTKDESTSSLTSVPNRRQPRIERRRRLAVASSSSDASFPSMSSNV